MLVTDGQLAIGRTVKLRRVHVCRRIRPPFRECFGLHCRSNHVLFTRSNSIFPNESLSPEFSGKNHEKDLRLLIKFISIILSIMTSLPFSLHKCFYLVVLASLLVGCVLSETECNHTVTKRAWFDIFIKDYDGPGEDFHGRFVIGLFGEVAPATVLNFASIANGYKHDKSKLHYKNTKIHRVVRDFVIQMGDVTVGDGTGGKSIYGEIFDDEDFILSHRSAGFVSMANHGKNTNGSQFFILLVKARWLDKRHVVFGKLIKGFDVIRKISDIETNKETGMPKKKIKIVDCGSEDVKKYCLSEAEIEAEEDIEKD